MADNVSTGSGIGLSGLLTVLFVGLKLGNVIDWKWIWVLAPLWIGFALFGGIVLLLLLIAILINK